MIYNFGWGGADEGVKIKNKFYDFCFVSKCTVCVLNLYIFVLQNHNSSKFVAGFGGYWDCSRQDASYTVFYWYTNHID